MTTRLVFVSDLHLGSVPKLDEFKYDDRFAALLQHDAVLPAAGRTSELVILGDAFDLWQSVPEQDCKAETTAPIDLGYDAAAETARLEAVASQHRTWFDALGKYALTPGCRVTVVPGNHDHSLVDPVVQQALRKACGLAEADDRISFSSSCDRPELSLYAEHGNQLERNNRYKDFSKLDPGGECRGYFFVRLFWNRMEYLDPELQNNGSYWRAAWRHLLRRKDWPLFATALRFFGQYWNDRRVKRHITPFFDASGKTVPATDARVELPEAPVLLVSGRRVKGRLFAMDREAERLFREAYRASPEVRKEVDAILASTRSPFSGLEAFEQSPEAAMPLAFDDVGELPGPPDDIVQATQLSEGKGSFSPKASSYRFVLIGHTHGERFVQLDNEAVYVNTGTWSRGGRLPVGFAELADGGQPTAWLGHLEVNGQLGW
jgi:UDP-2,3-diacylglucosamine pyrophosphatase LpxH